MKQSGNQSIIKSNLSLTSSVSQTSSYCSPRHFERKQKKPEKLGKLKMNTEKENVSYITKKPYKFNRTFNISNQQKNISQQLDSSRDINQFTIRADQLTNRVMKYHKTISNQIKQQISKSYSYHFFQDTQNQCTNLKQKDSMNSADLQQIIAQLERQNKKQNIQNKRNGKIAFQTIEENQKLKKVNNMQQQEIINLTKDKQSIAKKILELKNQNEVNLNTINQLNDKMKTIAIRPPLKRLQSDTSALVTYHEAQFLQETINKLRQQLFESNKKIKYQEVQIITLKRKSAQIQSKKKTICLLNYEKSRLCRKIQIMSRRQKQQQEIDSDDSLETIELSPLKQQ